MVLEKNIVKPENRPHVFQVQVPESYFQYLKEVKREVGVTSVNELIRLSLYVFLKERGLEYRKAGGSG